MPRPTKGPRLGGSPQHERHMLANLATQLFLHESIKTTEARARRLRPYAEKLITKGKRGDLHARRTVMKKVTDKYAVYRLFEELAPQFEGREGGYTRIVKTAPRKGDNAPMAVISLVLEPVAKKEIVDDAVATAKRAAAEAVKAEEPAAGADEAEEPAVEEPAAEADEAEEAAEDVKAEEPLVPPLRSGRSGPRQRGPDLPAIPGARPYHRRTGRRQGAASPWISQSVRHRRAPGAGRRPGCRPAPPSAAHARQFVEDHEHRGRMGRRCSRVPPRTLIVMRLTYGSVGIAT